MDCPFLTNIQSYTLVAGPLSLLACSIKRRNLWVSTILQKYYKPRKYPPFLRENILSLSLCNMGYFCGTFEDYQTQDKFDIIALTVYGPYILLTSEVLEKANSMLKKEGL